MNGDTPKPTEGHPVSSEPHLISESSGKISSWRDFADRVSAAMAMAAAEPGCIALSDRDFLHWPLGQREVVESFQQWVLGSSREIHCHVVAASFEGFALAHPRWVQWRKVWAHRVLCRQAPEELVTSVPTMLILEDKLALRLSDPLTGRGLWTRNLGVIRDWSSEIDVILQRSHDALPPTTLGL